MSETGQPWWADVQHLRPREDGDRTDAGRHDGARADRATSTRGSGRFARAATHEAAAVAVATAAPADELPLLDDIDWHAFVEGHAEVDGRTAARAIDPLAALDWQVDLDPRWDPDPAFAAEPEPKRDEATGRRTVEIRGHADHATAPVDAAATGTRTASRRRATPTAAERFHARPDRVAMWAFILGVVLMIVAALGTPEADAAVRLLG